MIWRKASKQAHKKRPSKKLLQHFSSMLVAAVKTAWQIGLFSAWNGNASIRLPKPFENYLLITATKSYKGTITEKDISLITLNGSLCMGRPMSSETKVHLVLYKTVECQVIFHTHPPFLLALETKMPISELFSIPIFEARLWNKPFGTVGVHNPGSIELACAVKNEATTLLSPSHESKTGCIWMQEHGLCVWGTTIDDALAASEELEHLARISLLGGYVGEHA